MTPSVTSVALTEDDAVRLIDELSADSHRRAGLAGLLREDHPIYDQRPAAVAARLRGWTLIALARHGIGDRELLVVLEELDSGLDPYTVAAAACALRSYTPASERFAPFVLQALHNLAGHDEPVSFDDYHDYGMSDRATTAVSEVLRTLIWLGPSASGVLAEFRALRDEAGLLSRETVGLFDQAIAAISVRKSPSSESCCTWPDSLRGVFGWRRDAMTDGADLAAVRFEDHDGTTATFDDVFRGRPSIVTFFYTRCDNPLKCSLTIAKLSGVASKLAERELTERIQIAAITYDPGFDTPERLRQFASLRRFHLNAGSRMLRATHGMAALKQHFRLGVNFLAGIVNRHRIEAFVLDGRGQIVASFERLRWDEAEVVERAIQVLEQRPEAGTPQPPSSPGARGAARSALTIGPALALALLPKCPVCWAAYFSALGVVGLEQTATLSRVEPLLIAALAVSLSAAWVRGRTTRRHEGVWITTLGVLAFAAAWLGGPDLRLAGMVAVALGATFTAYATPRKRRGIVASG